MILSTSPSGAIGRAQAVQAVEVTADVRDPVKSDRLFPDGMDRLPAALKVCPKIRPDVVERGRRLAADPAYPSIEIIRQLSARIVLSLDLAHDLS
jgi:hypothetical protein